TEAAARTTVLWPVLGLLGGLLVAGAGGLGLARGRRWARMGGRYDSPAARPSVPSRDAAGVWDALDRGDDPTARS
ncbi:MAG TPA: Trp biosynthesis-associated membrane protein, partial [Cryptosporangiaceae bacterium]|nr:Trp biosynthesis-associated membrane protein [Cryptosporangiaceae bacterium]